MKLKKTKRFEAGISLKNALIFFFVENIWLTHF